jgi:ribosomal protein S21
MTVRIVVRPGEPVTSALRRLKGQMHAAPFVREMWRHRCPIDPTQERRAKRFKKRFKAREATLLAQRAGIQPVTSLKEASARFWQRTGKP